MSDELLAPYVKKIFSEKIKPYLDFVAFLKQWIKIVEDPRIVLTSPNDLGDSWKGPLDYAIRGIGFLVAMQAAGVALITSGADPAAVGRDDIKILKESVSIAPYLLPTSAILASNLFKRILQNQPYIGNAPDANIYHITYIFSIGLLPSTALIASELAKYYGELHLADWAFVFGVNLEYLTIVLDLAGLFFIRKLAHVLGCSYFSVWISLVGSNGIVLVGLKVFYSIFFYYWR